MTIGRLLFVLGGFSLITSCNETVQKGMRLDASSFNIGNGSALELNAISILQTHCTACHGGGNASGGVSNITNVSSLLQAGLISPGQPAQSPLILAVESGAMPLGGSLASQDIQTLIDWVSGSSQTSSSSIAPSAPATGSASQPPAVDTSSLAGQAITILQNSCYACHGAITSGNVTQINDPTHLISAGLIIPGNAASSPLYVAVSTGVMPLGGSLSAQDVATLANWINAGAQAPLSGSVVAPPKVIPLTANFKSLMQNVIGPKCLTCHSGKNAPDGTKFETYAQVLKYVKAGDPSSSDIYDKTKNGEMPPRPNVGLTSTELSALSNWIKAGALDN